MAFPTAWQLLIPNWNAFTVIGVILIVLAIFGAKFLAMIATVLKMKPLTLSFTLVFFGVLFIWGISIIQDIFKSQELVLIMGGVLLLAGVAYLLFFRKKEGGGVSL